jgi:putative ABC transport system ATP-binding protein
MADAQLVCNHLTRMSASQGARPLLVDDVSFTLERGQVLAILGPSGSGKTTLLRMLNRLDEPTSGTVFLDGLNYREIPAQELRRRMGMGMQRAYLFPGTVAENIQFGPRQHGLALTEAQIAQLLEQVGLPGYASRDAKTLSGGEGQRVAIARALANEPEILLLDEPTSALDEASKRTVEELLCSIVHARHLTCIWVTHDRAQAERVASCALLLEEGKAVGFGPVGAMLHA